MISHYIQQQCPLCASQVGIPVQKDWLLFCACSLNYAYSFRLFPFCTWNGKFYYTIKALSQEVRVCRSQLGPVEHKQILFLMDPSRMLPPCFAENLLFFDLRDLLQIRTLICKILALLLFNTFSVLTKILGRDESNILLAWIWSWELINLAL